MADSVESSLIFQKRLLSNTVRLDWCILGSELFQCHIVIVVFSSDQIKLINLSSFSLHLFLPMSIRQHYGQCPPNVFKSFW